MRLSVSAVKEHIVSSKLAARCRTCVIGIPGFYVCNSQPRIVWAELVVIDRYTGERPSRKFYIKSKMLTFTLNPVNFALCIRATHS